MSDQLPHDEELRSLYRRLPADEPRAEIDEAILSEARKLADPAAHESTGGYESHRRRFLARARWILPLAAAASVVLTVTLTHLTPEQPAVAPTRLNETASVSARPDAAEPEAEKMNRKRGKSEPPSAAVGTSGAQRRAEAKEEASSADAAGKTDVAPAIEAAPVPAVPPPPPASARKSLEDSALASRSEDGDDAAASRRAKTMNDKPAKESPRQGQTSTESEPDVTIKDPFGLPFAKLGGATIPEDDRSTAPQLAESPPPPAAAPARSLPDEWPFGLVPGLDAAQACRRVEAALKSSCRFDAGVATVDLKEATVIDRGEFAGRKVTRITLEAPNGTLSKLALKVEGFTTDQILAAPPPPPP